MAENNVPVQAHGRAASFNSIIGCFWSKVLSNQLYMLQGKKLNLQKAKLERIIEKDPLLRKTIGFVLQSTIPSDVELCDIDSVEVDNKGKLKLVIPRHVDIVLPLGVDDANRLANELKDLIPLAKTKKKAYRKRVPLHTWWPVYIGEPKIHY
jgi:hypothetical protein